MTCVTHNALQIQSISCATPRAAAWEKQNTANPNTVPHPAWEKKHRCHHHNFTPSHSALQAAAAHPALQAAAAAAHPALQAAAAHLALQAVVG
jgi:hypothetical protein